MLNDLHSSGVITEHLSLPDDWNDLELSYRGLCRRDASSKRRRIGEYWIIQLASSDMRGSLIFFPDFLTVPYVSRGAALLYYTVSSGLVANNRKVFLMNALTGR